MNATAPSLEKLEAVHEHMATLCRRHHVRRLALFGSMLREEQHPGSDYDFLVEFDDLPSGGYASAFFGLQEDLQDLLEAPVDLIVERAIRNPYFREAVKASHRELYAA